VREFDDQHSLLYFNQSCLLQSTDGAGDERVVKTLSYLLHHYP
jgi:hypothetical protein